MPNKIFINYRRGDEPGFAQALFARLEHTFSPEQLFMDVDNIPPGIDFVRFLDEQVAECDVLLAVIGKNWIDARDETNSRRLDRADDFVRIEIEAALKQGKRVIPVLVNEARMPRAEELPEAIRLLARRNAVRLTHERFRSDAQGLVKALRQALNETERGRRAQWVGAQKADQPRIELFGQARTAEWDEVEERGRHEQRRQVRPAGIDRERPVEASHHADLGVQHKLQKPGKSRNPSWLVFALAAVAILAVAGWIATSLRTSPPGVLRMDGPGVLAFSGPKGGPFDPAQLTVPLAATGAGFHWSLAGTRPNWLTVSPEQGDLASDAHTSVSVGLESAARSLETGQYSAQLIFMNHSSNATVPRSVDLIVRKPAAPEVAPPAASPRKSQDRVGGDQGKTVTVPQRVVLYEEDPNDPQGKRFVGTAVWHTETVSPGPGLAPEFAVRADVDIPERRMKMQWSLRRNTDKTLPASHTIEIIFTLPPDFPSGGIANVPGILMKDSEQARGVPLSGLAVKVTTNYFLIGLSAVESDVQRNMDLLKNREWFDMPVVYGNNRRAIIAMEKGTPGDRAFAEAFAAWGISTTSSK